MDSRQFARARLLAYALRGRGGVRRVRWGLLSRRTAVIAPREPRVNAMGDKSPKSKDKSNKQHAAEKAASKAQQDKQQADKKRVLPAAPKGKGK